MVQKDCGQSEMVLQTPVAIVVVVVLAEVGEERPKVGIEIEIGFGIEEMVVKEFDSDVGNIQVRHPSFLNSKLRQLVIKAQL